MVHGTGQYFIGRTSDKEHHSVDGYAAEQYKRGGIKHHHTDEYYDRRAKRHCGSTNGDDGAD